ncbi:50S ribosomal protein L17 [Patescibacteria group bacterium]|nr:50S ribosomal protein L17 [Patescibacteria group bacterium]MBU4000096.1 50S ribosomal protein L17 [Patescibacteria group bacterium]MBU4056695.1 50S ribosomal protein L17 [Patescibacteria group bacterium]MBU4368092.1 50S ribosomal protein L17 [Patescibacteria group bacterium]
MRHLKKIKKLDRNAAARKSLLKSMSGSLILAEKIITTKAKARALAPHVERLISKAKVKNLASERYLLRFLPKPAVKKIFSEIAPRYASRIGGYTRIIKIGRRHHDKAEMAVVELINPPQGVQANITK